MANKSESPDERRARVSAELAEVAFDDAYQINEEYTSLITRRKANREQLRSLRDQGMLSDEQGAELDELYPPRSRAEEAEAEATEPIAA